MPLSPRVILLTFLGGALGTAARFGISSLVGNNLTTLFIVNLLGAFAIGLFNSHKKFDSDALRAFWGVGFAGGFTTMSGVAIAFVGGIDQPLLMAAIVLAMFWLGVLIYRLGVRVGTRLGAKASAR